MRAQRFFCLLTTMIVAIRGLSAVLIVGCGITIATSSTGHCDGTDTAAFDSFVESTHNKYEVPGAAVAIIENDNVVFIKGYGVRELGKSEAVDEDTIFQIASVTKLFTAAVLGILVDQGNLQWDDTIGKLLPKFAMKNSYASKHASLIDMLAHRSGLKAYDGDVIGRLGYTNAEIIRRVRFMKSGATFREESQYSNMGFFIAGEAVAHSDPNYTTWEEAVLNRLLQPIGMTRSSPYYKGLNLDNNHASGHRGHPDDIYVVTPPEDPLPAAGQIVSTASDMALFMKMLLGEGSLGDGTQILKSETVKKLFTPSMVEGAGVPPQYGESGNTNGLGCNNYHFQGYEIIEKNGALNGSRSIITLVPEKKIGIIVLANLNMTLFPEAVRAYFLEMYLGTSRYNLQDDINALQEAWDEFDKQPVPPDNQSPTTLALKKYAGVYKSNLYGRITITFSDDTLYAKAGPAGYPAKLTHHDSDTFLLQASREGDENIFDLIEFSTTRDSVVTGFRGESLGRFKKIAH